MYEWVNAQRDDEYAVSLSDIIDRAVSIDPAFHDRDEKKNSFGCIVSCVE